MRFIFSFFPMIIFPWSTSVQILLQNRIKGCKVNKILRVFPFNFCFLFLDYTSSIKSHENIFDLLPFHVRKPIIFQIKIFSDNSCLKQSFDYLLCHWISLIPSFFNSIDFLKHILNFPFPKFLIPCFFISNSWQINKFSLFELLLPNLFLSLHSLLHCMSLLTHLRMF